MFFRRRFLRTCSWANCPTTAVLVPGVGYNNTGPSPHHFRSGNRRTDWNHRRHADLRDTELRQRRMRHFRGLTVTSRLRTWRTTTSTCSSRFQAKSCCRWDMSARRGTGCSAFLDLNQPDQATITASDIAFAQANVSSTGALLIRMAGPDALPTYRRSARLRE